MPSSGGTLALTSQIKTKTSQLTNDSGFTTNKGTVTKVKVNGSEKSPDSNGVVDLGTISGGSGTSGKQLYWHNIYLEYHTSNIDCNVFLGIVTSSSTAITNATTFKALVNNYRNLNNILPVTGYIFIAKSSGVTQALALSTNGNMIFYRPFASTGSTESIAVSNFTITDKVTTL